MTKPPYRVPTLAEIAALPPNGLTVASTFSGGGGSSLGYKMAGFRVGWASEWNPHARAQYARNLGLEPDPRDVREVQAEEILAALALRPGELDVFDGSPPCQTFSTCGRREMADERTDLFQAYVRLLRGLQPRAFIAENVSGMIKGVARGMFKQVLADLSGSGYRVAASLVDARWLGVPQMRQRVIFVGFREDLGLEPSFPKPLPYCYPLAEVLPHIQRHGTSTSFTRFAARNRDVETTFVSSSTGVCYTITATIIASSPQGGVGFVETRAGEVRLMTIDEVKVVCSFPPDYQMDGTNQEQWRVLGNSVPPLMMRAISGEVRDRLLALDNRAATG